MSRTNKKTKRSHDPLLEGLNLTRNKQYVKLDEKLIERLRSVEPESLPPINPFENNEVFTETLKQGTPLTLEFLSHCSDTVKADPDAVKMAEMMANIPIDWLSLKRSKMLEDNWNYSVKFSLNPKVTDQGSSGTCWAQSSYNLLRYPLMSKYNLDHKFEFSEAYIFFYDKLERSNMFLEYIWTLRHRDITDREVRSFTSPGNHFTSDGGYFTYFTNLVSKYGLIPKNIYDGCFNSMVSVYLNDCLTVVLNHMALEIFRNKDNWSREYFQAQKDQWNLSIYDMIVRFLGEPPKPDTKFDWSYKDVNEEAHIIYNLTPEKFYRTVIPYSHETKMTVINDPRHPETYYMSSFSPYSLNMQDGKPLTMINLPMDVLKKLIYESLKNEDPVWFASDISKCLDRETNTSHLARFDYKSVLGMEVEHDKGDMLDMLTAVPNHALVFIGVDVTTDNEGNVTKYNRFRVLNSWGNLKSLEDDPDMGYHRMMDDYVDKYVFEAVVDIKYFDPEILEKIMQNTREGKSYTYDPYDAFGSMSLRAPCSHCNHNNKLSRPGLNLKK